MSDITLDSKHHTKKQTTATAAPLHKVRVGVAFRIKHLAAPPQVTYRLREMGFCEEQPIKLLSSSNNVICQVHNARMGLSTELASRIFVEPLPFMPFPARNEARS